MARTENLSNEEWLAALVSTFPSAFISSQMFPVLRDEASIGEGVRGRFQRQLALMESFQSFFVYTLNLARQVVADHGWPKNRANYSVALVSFGILFRRLRACEILYNNGYPLDGYSLMRDVKDRVFLIAAIATNRLTFVDALGLKEGLNAGRPDFGERTAENRKKVDNRVSHEFIGKSSGLSQVAQDNLRLWDELFHLEVHNASLTWTHEMRALSEGRTPAFGPATTIEAYAIYQNRSAEIGWMITRLLPFLQPIEAAFGDEWARKRKVLDAAFRHVSVGLTTVLGKPIGASFVEMVERKFKFKGTFHYFESTYKYP